MWDNNHEIDAFNLLLATDIIETCSRETINTFVERVNRKIQENILNGNLPELTDKPKSGTYTQAFKGDDEITVEETGHFGTAMIAIAEEILQIKVSWSDTSISNQMGNYAEEWILKPISAGSTYQDSTSFGRGNFVPWTLDTVKMKMLSPVRKQSQLEDDLESKLTHLGAAAEWCNPDWFTFDFHQMSLIMAMEIFDFSTLETFPFLNKEDGGLGCPVPYGNPDTLYLYANHYNRGRSLDAIKMIMSESNRVKTGKLMPNNTICLKGVSAYKAGSNVWNSYISIYKALKDKNITELDINDILKMSLDVEFPKDLQSKAIVVNVYNPAIATSISRLRTAGVLLTELDLLNYINQRERYSNLFNPDKTFFQLFQEEEARAERFRTRPMQLLSEIARDNNCSINMLDNLQIQQVNFDVEAKNYMKYSQKYKAFRTSFNNTGKVRIYRTSDVEKYFDNDNYKEFINSLKESTFDKAPSVDLTQSFPEDEEMWKIIMDWLKEPDPFKNTLPPGICTDDARLLRELELIPKKERLIISITNDRDLSKVLRQFIEVHNLNTESKMSYANISVSTYLLICHDSRFRNLQSSREDAIFDYHRGIGPISLSSMIASKIHSELLTIMVHRLGHQKRNLFKVKPIWFLYDRSNIERFSQKFQIVNRELKSSFIGFIRKERIRSLSSTNRALSLVPYEKIRQEFCEDKQITYKYRDPILRDVLFEN